LVVGHLLDSLGGHSQVGTNRLTVKHILPSGRTPPSRTRSPFQPIEEYLLNLEGSLSQTRRGGTPTRRDEQPLLLKEIPSSDSQGSPFRPQGDTLRSERKTTPPLSNPRQNRKSLFQSLNPNLLKFLPCLHERVTLLTRRGTPREEENTPFDPTKPSVP